MNSDKIRSELEKDTTARANMSHTLQAFQRPKRDDYIYIIRHLFHAFSKTHSGGQHV